MGKVHSMEVPCPGCGARLKAPDTMVGRKARCKKCGNTFRVPGGAARGSAGKTPPPGPALPGADEPVPMAVAVEEALPPPEPPPAPAGKGPAALPSADPFDFAGLPKPIPKPAAGAAKTPAVPRPSPATPGPAAPAAAPKPVAPTKPASTPPPAKPQPEIYSLDDDEPPTLEELPPDEPPAPSSRAPKRRDEDEDEPPRKRTREDPDEDEPRPRKRRREEADEDRPRPRKKRREGANGREEGEERKSKREEPEPAAAPGPGSNPFSFTAPGGDPDRPAKSGRDEDDLGGLAGSRYRRQKGSNAGLVLLITGAVAFVAILLGIVAVIVYLNKTRPPEPTKEQTKEEPPPPPAAPTPEPRKVDLPRVAPKPKDPKPRDPKAPTLVLTPRTKTFAVGPLPTMPLPADRPKAGVVIDSPLAAVRRVFPPFDLLTGDKHVLVQLAAGAGGKGPTLALDTYSASSDKRTGRIEFEGDGQPVPVCDLHASVDGVRFLAAVGGKISVWNVDDGKKLHDGLDPYAGKPEHQKAGLAAAFFAADPTQVVTVSTAGAVHLYDLRTRAATDEFVPRGGAAGKVALGRSVARSADGGSVALVVGGAIYQLQAAPGLGLLLTHELGGEAARSLGLAVSGAPGRFLYVFETDKKERAVAGLPVGAGAELIVYRWPEALGEPLGAFWACGGYGGVACASGVVWFDDDEGRFLPLVATQPAGPGLHLGDDRGYWFVVPHPTEPQKSALVALSVPFDDFSDFAKSYAGGEPLRAVRIDHTGLAK